MKLRVVLVCAASIAAASWMLWHHGSSAAPASLTPPSGPYSDFKQIAWLEKLGYVPTNASLRDRWLASYTSWWGKRIDPKQFWKGRVLWCDDSAMAAAGSHGRGYPPVPLDDPAVPYTGRYQDHRPSSITFEGYSIPTVFSSRESTFWELFNRTHPMPPERIESYQTSPGSYSREDALFFGCPPEALTQDAIHWANVLKWRAKYQAALALPPNQMAFETNYIIREASIAPKLLTQPLTDDQLKAAKAWKLAYLRRLRKKKTDESYINAYLKAWNLAPAEVFPENSSE